MKDILILEKTRYKRQKENSPLFLVPLGMKEWFADIGVKERVVELDWWESHQLGDFGQHLGGGILPNC